MISHNRRQPNAQQTREILAALVQLLVPTHAETTSYLTPLLIAARDSHVPIGTLNYDTALDVAAERADVMIDDGLDAWESSDRLAFHPDAVQVLRMHGYVGWVAVDDHSSGMRATVVRRRGSCDHAAVPAVVFGERNKLRPDGPFLDLFTEFRHRLRDAKRLVVAGYSFRDPHINESVLTWLRRHADTSVTVVDPAADEWRNATSVMGASSDPRFVVQLMRGFGDRVAERAEPIGQAAPELLD